MAFEGGRLSVLGISGSYLTGLATQTASSGVSQALGQVWQGAGQSFFGSAGQALGGALAGSAVNIALNSAFGTNVSGPQGLKLDSGANILASTITPYVTGAVAGGINQQIQKSLKNAGPFGPLLSNVGTQLVNQAANSLTNAITGATTPGSGLNIKMYPGGGGPGETEANYGGKAFTLNDVVFTLERATGRVQATGEEQTTSLPKSLTTVAIDQFTSAPPIANKAINSIKQASMKAGSTAFSKNLSSNFVVG